MEDWRRWRDDPERKPPGADGPSGQRQGPPAGAQPPRRRPQNTGRQTPAAEPGRKPTPQPRPSNRPPPPPPPTGKRNAGRVAKVLLAVISVAVFGASAFAWATITRFNNSLTTQDVIGSSDSAEKPADGAVDILLVGIDSRNDAQGNPLPKDLLDKLHAGPSDGESNTDTLILVHIPNDGRAATAVSIPRDSYVDIPGYGKHKINSAFTRAAQTERATLVKQGVTNPQQLATQTNQAGAKSTIAAVQELTKTTIDHYAEVNLVGFYDLSKAVGGVPVCLKQAVNDKEYSGAVFPKGEQNVQGFQALAFVRQRHNIPGGSTDLQRNRRQQAFLASMAHKILSAGTLTSPTALNSLIDALRKSLIIDQGWDITGFAQQMQSLTGGALKFSTIPIESLSESTPEDGMAVKVEPDQVAAFIRNQSGQAPPKPAAPPPPQKNPANAAITVDVRNGTSKSGMASDVLKGLTDLGYTAGDTNNAASRKSTVVRYASGNKDKATQVAGSLGGTYTLELDNSVSAGHVRVFLGDDYSGPGSNGGTSAQGSSGATTSGGSSGSSSSSSAPTPPEPPITADGTTCVD